MNRASQAAHRSTASRAIPSVCAVTSAGARCATSPRGGGRTAELGPGAGPGCRSAAGRGGVESQGPEPRTQ